MFSTLEKIKLRLTSKINQKTEMEEKGAKLEEATNVENHILPQSPITGIPLKATPNNWPIILQLSMCT